MKEVRQDRHLLALALSTSAIIPQEHLRWSGTGAIVEDDDEHHAIAPH